MTRLADASTSLYLEDETAWLEQTARLAAEKRFDEIDSENLREYLYDMARRDRRELYSRLVVLLSHLLKWEHQPEKRTGSWRGIVLTQRRDLRLLLESGTLRNHAIAGLAEAYKGAQEQAAETELTISNFPIESSLNLDDLIARESKADPD